MLIDVVILDYPTLLQSNTKVLPDSREVLLLDEPVCSAAGNYAHYPLQHVAHGGQQPSHLKIKSKQDINHKQMKKPNHSCKEKFNNKYSKCDIKAVRI